MQVGTTWYLYSTVGCYAILTPQIPAASKLQAVQRVGNNARTMVVASNDLEMKLKLGHSRSITC